MRFAKSFTWIVFSLLLCVWMAGVPTSASTTVVSTDPRPCIAALGSTENEVAVTISDVFNMLGYEFMLYYNTTILNVTDMLPHEGTTDETGFFYSAYEIWKYEINDNPWDNGTGYVWLAVTRPIGTTLGKSGSGKLATIVFDAEVTGRTALTFPSWSVLLVDPFGYPIVHSAVPGSVVVGEVAGIPPEADAGPDVYRGAVNATVTFNGTGSSDVDGTIESWEWDFGDGSKGTGSVVDHVYDEVGDYTVILTVIDNDGLIDDDYTMARIVEDKTPPTDGYINIAAGAQYTNKTSVTLSLFASDEESRVYQMCFSVNNETWTDWEAYTSPKSWTLTATEGTKTVYVKFRNQVLLESIVYLDTIKLDTTPPSLTITSPSEGADVKSTSVDVLWSGSDEGSAIHHYEVRLDDGSWTSAGSATTYTFSGLAEYGHVVEVKAVDGAGNSETTSVSFTVNTSVLGGPGMMEEAALGAVAVVAVLGVVVYFLKFRK